MNLLNANPSSTKISSKSTSTQAPTSTTTTTTTSIKKWLANKWRKLTTRSSYTRTRLSASAASLSSSIEYRSYSCNNLMDIPGTPSTIAIDDLYSENLPPSNELLFAPPMYSESDYGRTWMPSESEPSTSKSLLKTKKRSIRYGSAPHLSKKKTSLLPTATATADTSCNTLKTAEFTASSRVPTAATVSTGNYGTAAPSRFVAHCHPKQEISTWRSEPWHNSNIKLHMNKCVCKMQWQNPKSYIPNAHFSSKVNEYSTSLSGYTSDQYFDDKKCFNQREYELRHKVFNRYYKYYGFY